MKCDIKQRGITILLLAVLFVFARAGSGAAQESAIAPAISAPDPSAQPSDLVRVEVLEEERIVDFVLGPFNLVAGTGHYRAPIQITEVPVDGWMHGFDFELRDGEGNLLPPELLHHVNFIDPDHRELFSPTARRVLAGGRETGSQSVPKLVGVPLHKGQRILVATMLADDGVHDYPEVYLHVEVSYSAEGDGFLQPRDVYPFYMDVMGPNGVKDFPVPPGHSEMAWEASPAVDGRILGIGGHLHDYGTSLRLEDVTTGKVLWEGKPEFDEDGHVTGVPSGKPWWRGGIKIRTDHVYRVVAEYENPTTEYAVDGGMGAMGGAILVSKGTPWPESDRTNLSYATDLRDTIDAPKKAHGHHSH